MSRSPGAWLGLALVLLANAVALAAVWRGEWTLGSLMLLFWAENAVTGAVHVLRLAALPGPRVLHGMKFFIVPFFCVHYGGFAAIHGLFVSGMFVDEGEPAFAAEGFAVALVAATVAVLWQSWQRHRSYVPPAHSADLLARQHVDPAAARELVAPLMRLMFEPYVRVVILHLVLVLGAFGSLLFGSPWFSILLLLGMKTAYEAAQAMGALGKVFAAMR